MKKLTKAQLKKYTQLRNYLCTPGIGGYKGILLDTNSVTCIWVLCNIYKNCASGFISGNETGNFEMVKKKFLDNKDMSKIYHAAIRGDEDFKNYVNK